MTMLSDSLATQEPQELTKVTLDGKKEDPVKTKKPTANGQTQSGTWPGAGAANPQFPPPKTDKPRPHVCATCTRSFARLEHLKRHERSHTKEKPFECPECTRCFARRDLLLRHQQKLHLTTTPSSRQRNRRESTSSSITSAKVRKNSQAAQNGPASMRPRANTISHIDGGTLGMMAPAPPANRRRNPSIAHHRHASLAEYDHLGATGQRGPLNRMLKINTHGLNVDLGGDLRTAPAFGGFHSDVRMDDMFLAGNNTINPAQLHFAESPHSMQFDPPASPFASNYTFGHLTMDDDNNIDWINGFDSQMSFSNANEHAIAGSSPSAMSGGSPGQAAEAINESQMHLTPEQWQDSILSTAPLVQQYDNDWGLSTDMKVEPLSPISADFQVPEVKFSAPTFGATNTMNAQPAFANNLLNFGSQTNSPNTAASVSSGSNRHSSVTSMATEIVTDSARQSLLSLLSQSSQTGAHRKYSQPAVSSPLSPGYVPHPRSAMGANLPSTLDLQRYVNAYIQHFHPRLPFLHIPTLNFDTLNTISNPRPQNAKAGFPFSTGGGDGGCLLLSMAAIGALFEFEHVVSKELYELAKKLIHLYLEERRRADMCAAIGVSTNGSESSMPTTPLWLVQSMLLNVVYGHNCVDRPPQDLASTHCAALVNLARAAGLARPMESNGMEDIQMGDMWGSTHSFDDGSWYAWKVKEERKRTLYSIFVVSSVLVSLYNFPPCLTNSEIGLDLPCDESLWGADTPAAWIALGGSMVTDQGIPFAKALSSLLTTSQRHPLQPHQLQAQSRPTDARLTSPELPTAAFGTSSFGCLILINALHNYIWETRQRHLGRQWTVQETEAMQAHIGPALLSYQAVWRESSSHSVQRDNAPLANELGADCVPFLDLAFIRLFLSLGRSKECFWSHDWDGISREIAAGCEIISRNDSGPETSPKQSGDHSKIISTTDGVSKAESDGPYSADQSSKRERHLRKAAEHAAHSLHMADSHNVSLVDFASREVNLGSAICTLDSAEILAEWLSVVQERVGRYLGMLGRDEADLEAVPAIMLLESEDTALLEKIAKIIANAERKFETIQNVANQGETNDAMKSKDSKDLGWASRLLKIVARECDCAATWSVMNLMARNLEAQAEHMQARAEASLLKMEPTK